MVIHITVTTYEMLKIVLTGNHASSSALQAIVEKYLRPAIRERGCRIEL